MRVAYQFPACGYFLYYTKYYCQKYYDRIRYCRNSKSCPDRDKHRIHCIEDLEWNKVNNIVCTTLIHVDFQKFFHNIHILLCPECRIFIYILLTDQHSYRLFIHLVTCLLYFLCLLFFQLLFLLPCLS